MEVIGDWGDASTDDVAAVLYSVADCFAEAIRERPVEPILVEPTARLCPMVCSERTAAGQVRVLLSARGAYWCQYAYQFAHELCHILSNFRETASLFEEHLCEAASLFALRRMAVTWQSWAPACAAYAPAFRRYADEHAPEAPIARELLAGFEANPAAWRAIRYLNLPAAPPEL